MNLIPFIQIHAYKSSHLEVFLRNGILKICSKFTGEHPCGSAISIKVLCNFIETTLRYGCSPVNLLHIFRTPFLENTSWSLLLKLSHKTPDKMDLMRIILFKMNQRLKSSIILCILHHKASSFTKLYILFQIIASLYPPNFVKIIKFQMLSLYMCLDL